MKKKRYIWHLTLQTGHSRQSWRHEIEPGALASTAALLDAALTAERQADATGTDDPGTPLPIPGYRMCTTDGGRCLMVSVHHDDGALLATYGVADHARCGAKVWRLLTEIPAPMPHTPERPQTPWCVVRLHRGLERHVDAAHWLGDMERCIAWAWLERQR